MVPFCNLFIEPPSYIFDTFAGVDLEIMLIIYATLHNDDDRDNDNDR